MTTEFEDGAHALSTGSYYTSSNIVILTGKKKTNPRYCGTAYADRKTKQKMPTDLHPSDLKLQKRADPVCKLCLHIQW